MALSNRDRLEQGFDVLRQGLGTFLERAGTRPTLKKKGAKDKTEGTLGSALQVLLESWKETFEPTLGPEPRTYLEELILIYPKVVEKAAFNSPQTSRTLDTIRMVLRSLNAEAEAERVDKLYLDLQQSIMDEQARNKTRYQPALEGMPRAGLKAWREVVVPHEDVRAGRYQAAEFAADLAQVRRGEGSKEYTDPVEFFKRTYLTAGLKDLLSGALKRLTKNGGEPVVELQTNFGGGKTHSMLALFHLFGAEDAHRLLGVDDLLSTSGIKTVPRAARAVLVGTDLSPGQAQRKPDGTVVNTIWGEMAWQLGEAKGFALVADSDKRRIAPGAKVLGELFREFGPCLVLVDEWVAYARQLVERADLPAGTFDSQMTFAQSLTEAARATEGALVVASVPQSRIEVGGENGKIAMETLRNFFQRMGAQWRPASMEEGFEIVRRRLFEPIAPDKTADRQAVVSAYFKMYQDPDNRRIFPEDTAKEDYRRLMELSYPIHPELFQRLYDDWGTLDKFQRTRGVLRLMANLVRYLWERNDRGLMIMPASVAMGEGTVQHELTRYIEGVWPPIIGQDIDGENAVALRIDNDIPHIGRVSAARRVARTLFVGTAPGSRKGREGIDDRQVRLGCVQPGENVGTFGDALTKLTEKGKYIHQEDNRYWISTRPNLNRIAEDLAASKRREVEMLYPEIENRLTRLGRSRGSFAGVHVCPTTTMDIPDEADVRLVLLHPRHHHTRNNANSEARQFALECLTSKGTAPRNFQNCLVFLAPDKTHLDQFNDAVALYLAWSEIQTKSDEYDLDAQQRRQAETRVKEMSETAQIKLSEVWSHLLVPGRASASDQTITWEEPKTKGQGTVVERASERLEGDESLLTKMGPIRLRMELDDPNKLNWGGSDHTSLGKLKDWFARYLYLPRIKNGGVLDEAVASGPAETDIRETFAVAAGFDEKAKRYRGLVIGKRAWPVDKDTLVVKSDVAIAQRKRDDEQEATGKKADGTPGSAGTGEGVLEPKGASVGSGPGTVRPPSRPTTSPRILNNVFVGTVDLDHTRFIKSASAVLESIIEQLAKHDDAEVECALEIRVRVPGGIPDDTQRTVNENANVLRFKLKDFRRE